MLPDSRPKPTPALRPDHLALLHEAVRIAASHPDLEIMLDAVLLFLGTNLGWEHAGIVTLDLERKWFRCEALFGAKPGRVTIGYGRELGSGVVGTVAQEGRTVLLDDVSSWPDYVEVLPGARSELCVPAVHEGRVVGVLNLESTRPGAFRDQAPLLEAVMDWLASPVDAALTRRALIQRAHELELVRDITHDVLEHADLHSLLKSITDAVQRRLHLEIVGILTCTEDPDMLEFAAFSGELNVSVEPGSRWRPEKGVISRCLRERAPQLIVDVHADPDYIAVNEEVNAEYTLPILSGGELLGVMDLESRTADAFRQENRAILDTLVDQVAGAIRLARINQDIQRRAADLEMVRDLTRDALDAKDLGSLLGKVVEGLQKRFALEIVGILTCTDDPEELEFAAFAGDLPVAVEQGARWKPGDGVVGRCLRLHEAQLLLDVHSDPTYIAVNPEVNAEFALPIRWRDQMLGVVDLESRDPDSFRPENRVILQTIVDQVAGAIRLARANHDLESANKTLTEMFSRYVAPDLALSLLSDPERFRSRGERRHVCIMFADIRGFTTMSQQQSPERVLELLNTYFAAMGEEIFARRGSINRYLGDGLLAVFGAPEVLVNPSAAGVQAALAMQAAVDRLSPWWEEMTGVPLKVVISLNSGEVIVGTLGDPRHMEFTVLGDVVNVAARLEAESKARGSRILATDAVVEHLHGGGAGAKALGEVEVRGRTGVVRIFELL